MTSNPRPCPAEALKARLRNDLRAALLEREARERLEAAVQFDRHGQAERAAAMNLEAGIVARCQGAAGL